MSRGAIGVAGALGFSAVAVGRFRRPRPARSAGAGHAGGLPHGRALSPDARAGGARPWRSAPTGCAGPGSSLTLFALGVLVFSGSLYLLAITGVTQLGAVTPIGGLCLLAAWALLALEAAPMRRPPT